MSSPERQHPLDRISPYLDGELDPEERDRVDRHLADCAACRAHLASLRALAAAVAAEAPPPVPEGLAGRVAAAIEAAMVVPMRRRLAVPISIAATAAAAAILVVTRWHGMPAPSVPEPVRVAAEAIPSPPATTSAQAEKKALTEVGDVGRAKDEEKPVTARKRSPAVAAPSRPAPSMREGEEGRNAPQAAPPIAMRRAAPPPCAGPWADAGPPATWDVPDMQVALGDLAAAARDSGGRGDGTPVGGGEPYEIYVPKERYAELLKALAARGVASLPAAKPEQSEAVCLRLRVSIRVVLGAP